MNKLQQIEKAFKNWQKGLHSNNKFVSIFSELGQLSLEQDEKEPTKFVLTICGKTFILRLED